MNSKLIKASLAGVAAIAVAAAGGSTLASYSDFTDLTGNEAGAGVMKLTVSPNAGSQLLFDHVTMAPGGIHYQRNVYVASNDGASTPSGQLFVSLTQLKGTEDGCDGNAEVLADPKCVNPTSTDSTNSGDFIDDAVMQWTSYAVNAPGDCTASYAPASKVVTGQHGGSLRSIAAAVTPWELTGNGTALGGANRSYLAPGQGLCVSFDISLGYSADNASQGDSASFITHFDLKQAPYGTPTTPLP